MISHMLVVVGTLLATGNTLNTVLNVEEITSIHYAVDIIEQPVSREQVNIVFYLLFIILLCIISLMYICFSPMGFVGDVMNICFFFWRVLVDIYPCVISLCFMWDTGNFNHFFPLFTAVISCIVHVEIRLRCWSRSS